MRVAVLAVAAVTLLILAGQVLVSPSVADDLATCNNASQLGADAIDACTRELNAGRMSSHNLSITYNNRGLAYFHRGDYDLAIADYSQAIRLDPKDAYSHNNRGSAYRAKGDYDRAIADYDQSIQLDPKERAHYYNRGLAYSDKGDYDLAIADYNQAIQLDPKFATATRTAVSFTTSRAITTAPSPTTTRRSRLNPRFVLAYISRGGVYSAKGDYDRAIADYNQAIQINPEADLAYHNRGLAYSDKGDYDRAIADYNQAIQINPKYGETYLFRGLANLYAGDLPKALADLNQATALDPKDADKALWLDIVGQRNNVPSRLSGAISTIDMTAWPAPVIRMFLGQMPPAAVLAAADDPNATRKMGQVCAANFYSGELALRQNAKNEAARLFELMDCPGQWMNGSPPTRNLRPSA